tara:strand:- start:952 stop:1812 length:861 start_codon:yes stop_codon:yes gene_type:complete
MEKKNFKCLNHSCGISFTAENLGPCPVCGSNDTKLEKSRWPLYLIILLVMVGAVVFSIKFLDIESPNSNANLSNVNNDTLQITIDTLFHCKDVELNKPTINDNKLTIEFVNEDSISCPYLYMVNDMKKQQDRIFEFDDIKKVKNFKIKVFLNDSIIIEDEYSNDAFKDSIGPDEFDKGCKDFKNKFKDFIEAGNIDEDDDNRDDEINDQIEKLIAIGKKIGIKADDKIINLSIDGKEEEVTINGIYDIISAYSNYKTEIENLIEFTLDSSENNYSIKKIKVNFITK